MRRNLQVFAASYSNNQTASMPAGMAVFNMDQNQVATNANFCGTNNSGAMGVAANNSVAAAGNNGGGGGGMFSSFFSGATSSGGFSSQQYGGFSSQDGGKLAASEMGVGAGGAGGGLVERAMRDFNVWMPQSM